ncbi:MAG TPA: hypothetical protein PKD64_04695 [Pirellulaceae bacterium]|nr:hypothetical protein [Pirellulaceae bacterium]HMO91472.1 hypothetical protein [Pirellulaceae bacterium]HMP69451.1 hypothetical protein [Pirellulaceae bacterium]
MNRCQNRTLLFVSFVLVFLPSLVGCKQRGSKYKLDEGVARESMKVFLEAWRDGRTALSLKELKPSIVARDPDWDAGAELLEFSIPAEGESDGTNLYLDVPLTILRNGSRRETTIRYIIGTQPVISIFRDN